jgi:hypothetical protein
MPDENEMTISEETDDIEEVVVILVMIFSCIMMN